jgi:hypothetical protein
MAERTALEDETGADCAVSMMVRNSIAHRQLAEELDENLAVIEARRGFAVMADVPACPLHWQTRMPATRK